MTERKYQRGDRIKVIPHETSIGGIKVLREGFFGTAIKEYQNGDVTYVEVEGEGKYQGFRIIQKEFVALADSDTNIEYDGEFYILTCSCGRLRKLKAQHINQVKRCQKCQKEYDKKTAKARYKKRRTQ